MSAIPDDVSGTLEARSITIRREDLPAAFDDDSTETLEGLAEDYLEKVKAVDKTLADMHHDWTVRVKLDHERSVSVAEVGVWQRERWVEFRGMVSRIHQPVPEDVEQVWVCQECDNETKVIPPALRPAACSDCKSHSFVMVDRKSSMVDSQLITLAENFEEVTGSKPPRMLDCKITGTLVYTLSPGDRCIIGGVMAIRRSKAGNRYELNVNNVEKHNPHKDVEPPDIQGDVMSALLESFAPNVYGQNMVKKAILLMLVGGSAASDGRSSINVLLVGDPGIAKSMLLKEAAEVAPLGRYTSGRGSTAAGLTAGMNRDRNGTMYLEAGAAVLTDGGILCLDEFDKMREADLTALHEVMEQQTVSTTKLGTMVNMNARVGVLAAANPKNSRWGGDMSLADSINLSDALLTRFDLIFTLADKRDPDVDDMIAERIIYENNSNHLPKESITAYIESVRHLKPKMSREAGDALKRYYHGARAAQEEISVTPRRVAAAKRLAEAHAKIYRRDEVTVEDVAQAISLIGAMMGHSP